MLHVLIRFLKNTTRKVKVLLKYNSKTPSSVGNCQEMSKNSDYYLLKVNVSTFSCKLKFSAYKISNSRSIWTKSSYNRTRMAGGKVETCGVELEVHTDGHSPPDEPPPSKSRGPEWPKPG